MKKTAKVPLFVFFVGSTFIFLLKLKLDLCLILVQVLIVMPKNMRSSHKGKCIHLLLFLCIFYKIADWFSCSLLVVLSLLQNKEDVNRDWTKYDHYGSATMIMRLKATIQSL